MEDKYLFLISGLLVIILSITIFSFAALTEQTRTITTDCFDREYNKINGVTCEEEQYNYYGLGWNNYSVQFIFMGGVMLFLIGFVLVLLCFIMFLHDARGYEDGS